MAHIKAYSNHLEDLVKGLPMDDTHFITKLSVQQLLPGDTENKIKSMGTPADKASHFLSVVIKPALDINDTSDFEKLISVMQNCGFNRVKKLADTIKFEIDNDETTPHVSANAGQPSPAGPTPPKKEKSIEGFDCLAASRYLTEQWVALCKLKYDNMKLQLKANGVITDQERCEIDAIVGTNKMDTVLTIVQTSLDLELTKKYRGFLKSMEESKDDTLIEYAKNLGGSKSVPDH